MSMLPPIPRLICQVCLLAQGIPGVGAETSTDWLPPPMLMVVGEVSANAPSAAGAQVSLQRVAAVEGTVPAALSFRADTSVGAGGTGQLAEAKPGSRVLAIIIPMAGGYELASGQVLDLPTLHVLDADADAVLKQLREAVAFAKDPDPVAKDRRLYLLVGGQGTDAVARRVAIDQAARIASDDQLAAEGILNPLMLLLHAPDEPVGQQLEIDRGLASGSATYSLSQERMELLVAIRDDRKASTTERSTASDQIRQMVQYLLEKQKTIEATLALAKPHS